MELGISNSQCGEFFYRGRKTPIELSTETSALALYAGWIVFLMSFPDHFPGKLRMTGLVREFGCLRIIEACQIPVCHPNKKRWPGTFLS